jgi:hypothetical protein
VEAAEYDIEFLTELGRKARERDALMEVERIRKLAQADEEVSLALRTIAEDVDELATKVYGQAGALATVQELTYLNGKDGTAATAIAPSCLGHPASI